MRAVIQRVSEASVRIDQEVRGAIDHGLVILLGVEAEDGMEDVEWLANKIAGLRIFSDAEGKMNRSLVDVEGRGLDHQPIHPPRRHQKRHPAQLHQSGAPRTRHPALRGLYPGIQCTHHDPGRDRRIRGGT